MEEKNVIWNADDYNKSNGSQYRDAKETIEQIIKDGANTVDAVIVDIGCGSGNVTKILCDTLSPKKIFACDFDEKMVKFAQENSSGEKIEYFVQDISVPWNSLHEILKKLEGQVDLVWSNRVLHWITDLADKKTAVETIFRLLKPGGRCYINTTLQRDPIAFLPATEKEERRKYFSFETHSEQLEYWETIFRNSGLSQVQVTLIEKNWGFDNEELKNQMFSFMEPYLTKNTKESLKNLNEEDKKVLLDDMRKRILLTAQTPYQINPDSFTQEKLKGYYEQFRIIGIK